jgi:D-psicose/D-tagatose/L-ribulose 3-epimerase
MFKFGVDTFIWAENFSEKDIWIISKAKELGFEALDFAIAKPFEFPVEKVKQKLHEVGITPVTSMTLNDETNLISPDPQIRNKGIAALKKLVDINVEIGSKILSGVIYAGWGYLTGKPRTQEEWNWSVECMKEVAKYAYEKDKELVIAVECVNRFETHFLNIAEDAVRYCKDVGYPNIKVHLDCFHMVREELSFREAVLACGKEYLGYVHVCESNRGIPGTGLVPWKEFFASLIEIGYEGPMVIESFDPGFKELNSMCAIWRKFADSGEELAVQGLANLKKIEADLLNGK